MFVQNRPLSRLRTHLIHMVRPTNVRVCVRTHVLACPCISCTHGHRRCLHLPLRVPLRLFTYLLLLLLPQLSTDNREVWEESLRCLSLLVGLYGGQGEDCLSRSCLQSFIHVLRMHTQHETTQSTLEIIDRLVNIHKMHLMF